MSQQSRELIAHGMWVLAGAICAVLVGVIVAALDYCLLVFSKSMSHRHSNR